MPYYVVYQTVGERTYIHSTHRNKYVAYDLCYSLNNGAFYSYDVEEYA